MARRLDRIIVVDVESTCWEGPPPDGQENEIIEIGACSLDIASGERTDRTCILVTPERSTVSEFCTKLTSLTQAEVDAGVPLAEACAMLKQQFRTKDRLWASYGDYDRRQFERQCQDRRITYPFGPTHLNVKNLFALSMQLGHEVGMGQALEKLGIPLEGTHHRGVDDAWNIAAILAAVLKKLRGDR
jgi:inhibitor of KinA sporulation pathway (predicted exonuclease)